MLSVETNKEITEFKRDFMGGFGFKESVAILGGVIIGVVIMLVLIFATGIPIFIAPYIAMPFIAIPIISAFYNKDGMGFLKHRKKVKEFNKTKACIGASSAAVILRSSFRVSSSAAKAVIILANHAGLIKSHPSVSHIRLNAYRLDLAAHFITLHHSSRRAYHFPGTSNTSPPGSCQLPRTPAMTSYGLALSP